MKRNFKQFKWVHGLGNKLLGGGFTYFSFSSLLGEMIQFDEHIFPARNRLRKVTCHLKKGPFQKENSLPTNFFQSANQLFSEDMFVLGESISNHFSNPLRLGWGSFLIGSVRSKKQPPKGCMPKVLMVHIIPPKKPTDAFKRRSCLVTMEKLNLAQAFIPSLKLTFLPLKIDPWKLEEEFPIGNHHF